MQLVSLLKMCPTETYSEVPMSNNFSYLFPAQNGLEQDDLSPLRPKFSFEYVIRF
jgi:hypothetical protein